MLQESIPIFAATSFTVSPAAPPDARLLSQSCDQATTAACPSWTIGREHGQKSPLAPWSGERHQQGILDRRLSLNRWRRMPAQLGYQHCGATCGAAHLFQKGLTG